MSRSVRAETRSRAKFETSSSKLNSKVVRHWEKKWVTIGDTTMKIYKWVPINNEKKKSNTSSKIFDKNLNNNNDKENHSQKDMAISFEDSNTCFSMVSDSQGDFVSSMPFSEDSNSQGSIKTRD